EPAVRLIRLVNKFACIARCEDQAEAEHGKQHEPRPRAQPDCSGEKQGENDRDDAECERLGVDTENLRASFAGAGFHTLLRRLRTVVTGLASALTGQLCGLCRNRLLVTIAALECRADQKQDGGADKEHEERRSQAHQARPHLNLLRFEDERKTGARWCARPAGALLPQSAGGPRCGWPSARAEIRGNSQATGSRKTGARSGTGAGRLPPSARTIRRTTRRRARAAARAISPNGT